MIENGQRGITVETAMVISRILDSPMDVLFSAPEVHGEKTGTVA